MSDSSESKHVQKVEKHVTVSVNIEEISSTQTEPQHRRTKSEQKAENNDTNKKENVKIVELAHISEQTNNENVQNLGKDDTIRVSIEEEISSEIQLDRIHPVSNKPTTLTKTKNESNKRKEKVVCSICPKSEVKYPLQNISQKLPKYHKRKPLGDRYPRYGFAPKLVYFESSEYPTAHWIFVFRRKGYQVGIKLKKEIKRKEIFNLHEQPRKDHLLLTVVADPTGDPIEYEYEEGDRNDFVKKVFFICSIMLSVTFAITIVTYLTSLKHAIRSLTGLILLAFAGAGTLTVQYVYCCSNCSRVFPCNVILNIIVTITFSYFCAFLTAKYAPIVVISAIGTTLLMALCCLGLAFTSFDFTRFILSVTILCVSLLVSTIICAVLGFLVKVELTILHMILLVLSTVFSSTLMVIEMQMILGGKSLKLGDEDYTFGAYMVYTSILSLSFKCMEIIDCIYGNE